MILQVPSGKICGWHPELRDLNPEEEIKEFAIHFGETKFDELYLRIRLTRLPPEEPDAAWETGTDCTFLSSLLGR